MGDWDTRTEYVLGATLSGNVVLAVKGCTTVYQVHAAESNNDTIDVSCMDLGGNEMVAINMEISTKFIVLRQIIESESHGGGLPIILVLSDGTVLSESEDGRNVGDVFSSVLTSANAR